MAETKEIGCIKVITDDDTGMYSIGEVDGGFDQNQLDQFLQDHGDKGYYDLTSRLAYMSHQLIIARRKLHHDFDETKAVNTSNP